MPAGVPAAEPGGLPELTEAELATASDDELALRTGVDIGGEATGRAATVPQPGGEVRRRVAERAEELAEALAAEVARDEARVPAGVPAPVGQGADETLSAGGPTRPCPPGGGCRSVRFSRRVRGASCSPGTWRPWCAAPRWTPPGPCRGSTGSTGPSSWYRAAARRIWRSVSPPSSTRATAAPSSPGSTKPASARTNRSAWSDPTSPPARVLGRLRGSPPARLPACAAPRLRGSPPARLPACLACRGPGWGVAGLRPELAAPRPSGQRWPQSPAGLFCAELRPDLPEPTVPVTDWPQSPAGLSAGFVPT